MKVRGDVLGPPRSTDKTTLIIKVSKGAKIRNRYNQVPHLTQDTNGKVTNSQKTPQTRAKRSALTSCMSLSLRPDTPSCNNGGSHKVQQRYFDFVDILYLHLS